MRVFGAVVLVVVGGRRGEKWENWVEISRIR